MIRYKSTRGNLNSYTFSEAILKGIAEDGGLLVPEKIPIVDQINLRILLTNKTYAQKAFFILRLFETDIEMGQLQKLIHSAYSDNFDNVEIVPLVHLKNNQYMLELWHGPTSAFKDMALQFTPLLFSEAIKTQKKTRYLILVATSGDTGKAALEGFKDKENISIMVFYPSKGVSKLQKIQMETQEGSNLAVYAAKGDFDAVQKLVKEVMNDFEFNKKLFKEHKTIISSANSINWGRLLPQIVYHITSYLNLLEKGIIKLGKEFNICVPTGNSGNILAAFYAKRMGLPIKKLICASNANNVLTEFLKAGVYDISKRNLIKTSSPSMDILVASNIERLLYEITQDPYKVSQWMSELRMNKKFEVDDETKKVLKEEFHAGWVTNEDCLKNIKKVYEETGYLMDPHTSCAQAVTETYCKESNDQAPLVICSTAHWAKFAKDVYKALGGKAQFKDVFEILNAVIKMVPETFIPESIGLLKTKKIRFKTKCEANIEEVERLIIQNLSP